MTRSIRSLGWIAVIGFLQVVGGCAASGPPFQPVSNIPPDKGVVYVYRPASFVGGGMGCPIGVDGRLAGTVSNGSYLPLILDPGIHVINVLPFESSWLRSPESTPIDVNVDAASSHYVRLTISVLNYANPAMARSVVTFQGVDEPVARQEIASLR